MGTKSLSTGLPLENVTFFGHRAGGSFLVSPFDTPPKSGNPWERLAEAGLAAFAGESPKAVNYDL